MDQIIRKDDELLTVMQLQHRLEVTPPTIFNWKRGSQFTPPIPYIENFPGRAEKVLFSVEAVAVWLEKYRPKLLSKLRSNVCNCKHCSRERESEPIPTSIERDTAIATPA